MNESINVETQLSTTTARLGDLVGLQVVVSHPAYVQIDAPNVSAGLGTFEVFASTMLPVERAGEVSTTRFQAQLQNFTTGPQLLPSIPLTYRDLMEKVHKIQSSSATVTIQPMPPDPKAKGDILGIRGIVGPIGWSPWWWLVAVLLLAAVCGLLWYRRKRIVQGPPPPPPEPVDDRALRLLDELVALGWLESGKLKEFYSSLSDIVRGYLEGAFHVQALERTTSELMRDLRRKSDLPSDRQALLKELLEMCDLVKFAKFRPDAEEALADHQKARAFVEETRAVLHKGEKP